MIDPVEVLQVIACPWNPKHQLAFRDGGSLYCESCSILFPVSNGLPDFFQPLHPPAEDWEDARVMDHLWPRLAGAKPSIVARTEYDAIRSAAGDCTGLRILDAGCGLGQPAPAFQAARGVFCVDWSKEALRSFRYADRAGTYMARADVKRLPFKDGSFDLVVAAQLLPHLRTPEERNLALQQLSRVTRKNGRMIITTLHYNFRFPKLGMAKSGTDDGVFFFRHTVEEFRCELSETVEIVKLWGVWNYPPKLYRLFIALDEKTLYWDRMVRRTGFSLRYGKQLLAVCLPKG